MDSGGSMQSNEERGAEKAMDDYLRSVGFQRKKIAKDGSCLFRAVAEQVLHCQSLHTEVRAQCVEFLKKNRDQYEAFIEGDFEDYLWKLQDPQQWVGEVEISALSVMYKRDFLIYQEPGKPAVNITSKNFKDKVLLCFLNGNHYDSVYPISHVKNKALCQSILYELLYDGVFKVDRSSFGPCQRTARPSDFLIDDRMAACVSSDESDLDTHEPLWVENGTSSTSTRQNYRGRGRGRQLPERVRRSLNPTLLRNVEYDVWHKSKRAQQKMDYSIAAGMHFSVGDHCQVRLEGNRRSYNATVQEVPSNGQVTVFIEELGRKQVPLWNLRPPCDENSWSSVVSKKLSNGHGEWEERGKGRGRGRSVTAASSPSVTQASGSGGRMQKQHSWPPQASVEDQGGAKASSRKSLSSAEAAFGLTEEQRLAREEDEKNTLLMEIQLRDEHSFPALGAQPVTQGDGGKRKGGEKKRSQRNKTKSPVEDVRAPSPSAGQRPKSSTPPAVTTAAPANQNSVTVKAATPNINMSAAVPGVPPASAAPSTNTNTQSCTSAAAAPSPPPPVSSKPPTAGGAPPLPPSVPSSASIFSYVTPVLPAASSPPTSLAISSSSPPSSSSSKLPTAPLPLKSAASSSPPPTFIAPIAPSPTAALGFNRSSSPVFSVPRAPSPPTSSSILQPAAHVQEAPPAPAQSTNFLPKTDLTLTSQTSLSQTHPLQDVSVSQTPLAQNQSQAALPQNQIPQMQPEAQQQPQSHSEDFSHLQLSYPHNSHPDLHMQAPPPLQPDTPSQTETPQHTETQACSPSQQSHPPPHAHLQPAHPPPPHPQSIPGTVPLQQLSQLYQDPLYPGFPQGENGSVAPPPPLSSSSSGDDLPRDINILKFFFNLGVKAYTLPMCPPYIYLLPLQQAHALNPKPSSRSPSPQYPPSRHPEPYPPPQYRAPSVPTHYDHQAPLPDPSHPSEPSFSQAGYHRMSWQQMAQPRNPSYLVGYPSSTPPYTVPPPSTHGRHPHPGHPLYPPPVPPYAQSSLGYRPPSTPEEVPVGQGSMEQHHPPNGDMMSGHGHARVHTPVESPSAANVANANTRTVVVPSNFGGANVQLSALKKDPGESLTRAVLLVDPPLNNTPILALVPDPDVKDLPVSMTTINPSSSPASSSSFRGPRPVSSTKSYVPLGPPEPGMMSYLAEPLSVGCSTEDDREEMEGYKAKSQNYRGQRRGYRGGRGRGGYDPGRGYRRRHGGEGFNQVQFSSSHRLQGREYGH